MAPPRSISLPDFISLNRVFPLVSNDKEAFLKGTPHKTWVATLDEFERRDESTRSALLDAFVASGSDVTANVYSDDEEGRTSQKQGRLSWSLGEAVLCTAQLSDYLGRDGSSSKSITERLDRRSNLLRVSIKAADAVECRKGSLKLWRFVIHHEQLSLREDEVQSTSRLQLQTQAEAGDDVDPEALGTLVEYDRMFSAALGEGLSKVEPHDARVCRRGAKRPGVLRGVPRHPQTAHRTTHWRAAVLGERESQHQWNQWYQNRIIQEEGLSTLQNP
ncbi:hypothetical protein EHS25_008445 [Saitozyma podzolica]|uniref:Uncharacterized protein n=1 Tax=Saitozyma podzolica TaxID=1890683 RepID=A0A427YPJ8_9TREE|nr:hypothetical protein EHS25_008445 [Saitozyma podzolica]